MTPAPHLTVTPAPVFGAMTLASSSTVIPTQVGTYASFGGLDAGVEVLRHAGWGRSNTDGSSDAARVDPGRRRDDAGGWDTCSGLGRDDGGWWGDVCLRSGRGGTP